jgi:hypothetical protein
VNGIFAMQSLSLLFALTDSSLPLRHAIPLEPDAVRGWHGKSPIDWGQMVANLAATAILLAWNPVITGGFLSLLSVHIFSRYGSKVIFI